MTQTIDSQTILDALKAAGSPDLVTETADGAILAYGATVYRDESDPTNPGWAYRLCTVDHGTGASLDEFDSGAIDSTRDIAYVVVHIASELRKRKKAIGAHKAAEAEWAARKGEATALVRDTTVRLAEAEAEIQRVIAGAPESLLLSHDRTKIARAYTDPQLDPRIKALLPDVRLEATRYAEAQADRRRQTEAAKERRVAKYEAERSAWVESHGSERLRAASELDLLDESNAVYRDERLAADRPGWAWDTEGVNRDIRNPSMEALTALREARETYEPAITLIWLVVEPDHSGCVPEDEDCDDDNCDAMGRAHKGPALLSKLMGDAIIRRF